MTPEEKQLVSGLFDRLRQADTQSKDAEAETLIRQSVAAQPSAPYLLVQTLLVQEHALSNAQTRIASLEKQLQEAQSSAASGSSSHGGFLSSLFGSSSQPAQQQAPQQPAGRPAYPPQPAYQGQPSYQGSAAFQPPPAGYAPTTSMPASSGSGFLGSAVKTAAGVAGGALLFEGVSSLLSHNAGPFGGGMMGGGMMGGGAGFLGGGMMGGQPTEIVNNYYEGAPPTDAGYDQGGAPAGADQGYDQASYDTSGGGDSGFDSGGGADDTTSV